MSTKNGGTATGKVVKEKSKALIAREAKEEASVARFKATASKVMDVLNKSVDAGKDIKVNGKAKPKAKAPVKPKVNRQTERLAFIRQNSATILKAWDALPEGKRSGAALNRVLPKQWHNKFIDEVLMLNGLRQSGEQVVIKAVNEDKPLLKNGKAKADSEAQVQA